MSVAMEDGEDPDQQRGHEERSAHLERHRSAEQNGGRSDPVFDARHRHAYKPQHSAHRHDQGKRNRQHPDGGGAKLRAPQADRDHREDVIRAGDRVQEARDESVGFALQYVAEGRLRPERRKQRERKN